MIYLFYGNDFEKVRTKAFDWVAKARAKEPNLAYMRLAREELTREALEDAVLSGGLFVSRRLFLLDDPFSLVRASDEEEGEEVVTANILDDYLDVLASSDNAIIILAPKLSAIKAKKIVPKAKVVYEYNETTSTKSVRGFNSALVNALGARSSEKLWLEVNRAIVAGDAPEMLHGLLHWKARDLMEKGSRDWNRDEARHLSLTLITLLQESRRGGLALALALEKFALTI
jgi:hypothetical protein